MKELLIILAALVAKAIFSKVIGDEFNAVSARLAHWLVKKSARWLVVDAERYEEQWLADLEDRKTPLRKMLFASGLPWSAAALRRASIYGRAPEQKPSEHNDVVEREADGPGDPPAPHDSKLSELLREQGWVIHVSTHDSSGRDVIIYSADGREIGSLQLKMSSQCKFTDKVESQAWPEGRRPKR